MRRCEPYESTFFGIERLLLEGGSILNGAFQRAGAVDELSLVVDPVIAGKEGRSLFTDSVMEEYTLAEICRYEDVLWLNYKRTEDEVRQCAVHTNLI